MKRKHICSLLLIKGLANVSKCYNQKTKYKLQPFLALQTVTIKVSSRSGWVSKLKYILLWQLIKRASFTFFHICYKIYQGKFWEPKINWIFLNSISLGVKLFYHFWLLYFKVVHLKPKTAMKRKFHLIKIPRIGSFRIIFGLKNSLHLSHSTLLLDFIRYFQIQSDST